MTVVWMRVVAVEVEKSDGSGHNLNIESKDIFQRLGTRCKRNSEVKAAIQMFGLSN